MRRRMCHDSHRIEHSVGSLGQRHETRILSERDKYRIYAGFHHLLRTNGLKALVLEKMPLQQRERFIAIPSLGIYRG